VTGGGGRGYRGPPWTQGCSLRSENQPTADQHEFSFCSKIRNPTSQQKENKKEQTDQNASHPQPSATTPCSSFRRSQPARHEHNLTARGDFVACFTHSRAKRGERAQNGEHVTTQPLPSPADLTKMHACIAGLSSKEAVLKSACAFAAAFGTGLNDLFRTCCQHNGGRPSQMRELSHRQPHLTRRPLASQFAPSEVAIRRRSEIEPIRDLQL
jgi:hypothetical protein